MRPPRRREDALVAVAFLPLHKLAVGVASAVVAAIVVFLATAIYLVRDPQPGFALGLLAQYFAGYSVSWRGAFIGAGWAGFSGFVLGWFLAFSRNLLVGIMLFVVRRRAEWDQTKDFLDHL
jgi:hypothetical protein